MNFRLEHPTTKYHLDVLPIAAPAIYLCLCMFNERESECLQAITMSYYHDDWKVREQVSWKDKMEEAWQMKSNFIRPATGVSCYPYLKRIMVVQRSVLPSHLSAQIHHNLDCFF